MGHEKSSTFQKYYLSTHVRVDIQAIFLGGVSRADLIKEIGELHLRRDKNLPRALTAAQQQASWNCTEIKELQAELSALSAQVKNTIGRIRCKDTEQHRKYQVVQARIRCVKLRKEREAFQKLLKDFHSTSDLDHVVAQMMSQELPLEMLEPVEHILDSWRWLSEHLSKPAEDSSFAEIVETMAGLCLEVEERDIRKAASKLATTNPPTEETHATKRMLPSMVVVQGESLPQHVEPSSNMISSTQTENEPRSEKRSLGHDLAVATSLRKFSASEREPGRLTPLTCLFCYNKQGRQQSFKREDGLHRHYRSMHFYY